MQNRFSQSFSWANIVVSRNYCHIGENPNILTNKKTINNDLVITEIQDRFEAISLYPETDVIDKSFFKVPKLPNRGPKRKYFYSDKIEDDFVSLPIILNKSHYTTKSDKIKKFYANPFATIRLHTIIREINVVGNKVHISIYQQLRKRSMNCKYFRKTSIRTTLTIDLLNGDFLIRESNKSLNPPFFLGFRKNSFRTLEALILNGGLFKNGVKCLTLSDYAMTTSLSDDVNRIIDNEIFFLKLQEMIPSVFRLDNKEPNPSDFLVSLIQHFIIKKSIKVPNDYMALLINYYPTKRFIKKNNDKLVQSILDSFGIKSKLTIKIAHTKPKLNYSDFASLCGLFGENYTKYIGNLTSNSIDLFCGEREYVPLKLRKQPQNNDDVSDTSKESIVKIINSLQTSWSRGGRELLGLFNDHFMMMGTLNRYYPNIDLNSTTYDSFHDEHLRLARLFRLIKKGWTYEYVYDNRMLRLVESEIRTQYDGVNYVFYPHILKSDVEFNEEGDYMRHCVSSYISKEGSLIISLRLKDGSDRVTCEYNKKTGRNEQQSYFTNNKPPEYFQGALNILNERIKKFSSQRLLEHIELKKTIIKINGIEVKTHETNIFNDLWGFF
jgi:hypothetical protein